jgi:hypothetical protein
VVVERCIVVGRETSAALCRHCHERFWHNGRRMKGDNGVVLYELQCGQ